MGTYTYSSGDVYEGEWKDNAKDGAGTYTYSNGDCFVGTFRVRDRGRHFVVIGSFWSEVKAMRWIDAHTLVVAAGAV